MLDQLITYAVIVGALGLFVAGRWRYDLVALSALLVLVLTGVVPSDHAFAGLGHPAVVTVAAILVISRCLSNSGAVDRLVKVFVKLGDRPALQLLVLTSLVTLLSGFMNNVGALALLLPVAVRASGLSKRSPGVLLMPLAFGSILGGLTTLIGTPPNIIIAMAREQAAGQAFRMFDFLPVGGVVAVVGMGFIVLGGWRLIPRRGEGAAGDELFRLVDYISELRVTEDSKLVGLPLRELNPPGQDEVVIAAIVRHGRHYPAPSSLEPVQAGDLLVVEAEPENLQAFIERTGFELAADKELDVESLGSAEISLFEAVVMPESAVTGRSARTLNLRWRYGVNLLGVSRRGVRIGSRLGDIRFQAGDVLLLQGPSGGWQKTLANLGCLPLAQRRLTLGRERRGWLAIGLFGSSLAAAALGLVPVHVALVAVALVMVLAGLLAVRDLYDSIEWPVIILLGAMIPVGGALETTGGATQLAGLLLRLQAWLPPAGVLAVLMVATVVLTNVVNNAAAAVLMAPIAIKLAAGMGVSMDPLLIGVGIAASTAFMTPIGHQSCILVMGPGGYRYGDYWRLGLPLTVLVLAVAVPLILRVWPL